MTPLLASKKELQVDLKTAFSQAAKVVPRKTRLDEYRETLSKEDATALSDALSSTLTSADIARVLSAQGFPIGETTIRRERNRLDLDTQVNGL